MVITPDAKAGRTLTEEEERIADSTGLTVGIRRVSRAGRATRKVCMAVPSVISLRRVAVDGIGGVEQGQGRIG